MHGDLDLKSAGQWAADTDLRLHNHKRGGQSSTSLLSVQHGETGTLDTEPTRLTE